MTSLKGFVRALLPVACCLLPVICFAEQLEMDVITVYGKESYRLRKEVFDLLAPLPKEEFSKMKLKKRAVEEVAAPEMPPVADYDTNYPIRPAGDVPTISIVKTGLLLYFLSHKPQIENLHLEFVSAENTAQDVYLKRVQKDQYVEIAMPPGFYRMNFTSEGMEPAYADSIVVRAGQISLALVSVQELRPPPPPPPPPPPIEKVEVAPPAPVPPHAPEKQIDVRLVPLKKRAPLPEAQPMMVARGRVTYQEKGLANMEVRLYEKEPGFFGDPYDPALEGALLAVTVTDSMGNFEFPPIDNDDGFLEGTRDPLIVLSLENSRVSVLKPFSITKAVPYRYVIYQKDNVHPELGNLQIGQVAVNLKKERPVILFENAVAWTRNLPYPIRILYPSGSSIKLQSRLLEVPSAADFSTVGDYLTYLAP